MAYHRGAQPEIQKALTAALNFKNWILMHTAGNQICFQLQICPLVLEVQSPIQHLNVKIARRFVFPWLAAMQEYNYISVRSFQRSTNMATQSLTCKNWHGKIILLLMRCIGYWWTSRSNSRFRLSSIKISLTWMSQILGTVCCRQILSVQCLKT